MMDAVFTRFLKPLVTLRRRGWRLAGVAGITLALSCGGGLSADGDAVRPAVNSAGRENLPDVPKINLEGDYRGHLQDVWYDGKGNLWWAHTHEILRTDTTGKIIARVAVEQHNAGLEVKDGRLYIAVCPMQNTTGGKTTPECRVQINVHDAQTLKLLETHRIEELNDRAGSLCILEDGSFLVGCLRPQDITPSQVRFHHISRDYKPLSAHIVDGLDKVRLGIEVIKRRGNSAYLFVSGGPTVEVDAKTFKEISRGKNIGGPCGFVFDGARVWTGQIVRDPQSKRWTSFLRRHKASEFGRPVTGK